MQIKFWGVRGSIPTPSTVDFASNRYGGNTSCVSVRVPGALVILDAGSGLRNLGLQLTQEPGPVRATFFFSHAHWDHVQGFPFFAPAFGRGNSFKIYGPSFLRPAPLPQPDASEPRALASGTVPAPSRSRLGTAGKPLCGIEAVLRAQQEPPHFPVRLADMGAQMSFADLDDGASVTLKGTESKLVVTGRALKHPGGCFGYRVEEQRADSVKTFVYATDAEAGEPHDPNLQLLAQQADVFYFDAQYTPDEYTGADGVRRVGWGHSTWQHSVREARAAGVAHLLLMHHDPRHDDWAVARIEDAARAEGAKTGLRVTAAYEEMEIEL